jgi:hypothetical protein
MTLNFQLTSINTTERLHSPNLLSGDSLNAWLTSLKGATTDFVSLTIDMEMVQNRPEEYWYIIGSMLERIAKERIYLVSGYRSFSDFCARGLGYSRQHSYKMMKAVQFIDDLRANAETEEQFLMIYQLFTLGFTKLYLLHFLPVSTLKQLFNEGITVPEKNGLFWQTIPLDVVTVGQLKRGIEYLRNLQRTQLKMAAES